VEVKTRSTTYFGPPEIFVDQRKTNRILQAAKAYLERTGHEWAVRFDVMAILFLTEDRYTVRHLEDAFFPGLDP
jgi:putative endonuclease